MGDQGPEHIVPPTQLEEIASKISGLDKWRDIFSLYGLEISNTTHQPNQGSVCNGAPGAGEPVGLQPPQPPCTIPEPPLVPPDMGGQPISSEMAMGLQKLLFGNVSHVFSCEWEKAHFRFRQPYSDLAYALEAGKGGTRAILMAVQAYIIKYLLFERSTEDTHLERLRGISRWEQDQALAAALAELLWAAGASRRAVTCLTTAATRPTRGTDRGADSLARRIQLFVFSEKAAVQEFIFNHIHCFRGEESHGVILLLYSLLFSRTLERVQEDLGCTATPLLKFSFGNVTCTQAMLSLLLTGQASPHGLDGGQELGSGGMGAKALQQRAPVGYLHWGRAQAEHQVCPGLRTPQVPVWLCSLSGRHSVLFGTNSRLLADWRAERVFHLYFYAGQREQTKTAHLTIDTHSHHWEEDRGADPSSAGKRRPSVEMAIRTKWAGATISWNGADPFF